MQNKGINKRNIKNKKIRIMIEWLRHFLGLCGEPHPNLWTLLAGAPILGYVIARIKQIFKNNNK